MLPACRGPATGTREKATIGSSRPSSGFGNAHVCPAGARPGLRAGLSFRPAPCRAVLDHLPVLPHARRRAVACLRRAWLRGRAEVGTFARVGGGAARDGMLCLRVRRGRRRRQSAAQRGTVVVCGIVGGRARPGRGSRQGSGGEAAQVGHLADRGQAGFERRAAKGGPVAEDVRHIYAGRAVASR
ncbi:hypothetical protein DFJ74DRAFT_668050 [Hyaloraphidium curvatum]|nr:hypothetical protein DFJ74DRAFT_668050 [Hyaloraphidium curvatum]